MITNLAPFTDNANGWQRVLYAFLVEKEQHSGSRRTVEDYSRMGQAQQHFRRRDGAWHVLMPMVGTVMRNTTAGLLISIAKLGWLVTPLLRQ